jgi:hypothetical protein
LSRHWFGPQPDRHLASPEARLALKLPRKIDTPHSHRVPQMKDDPRFAASRICHAARSSLGFVARFDVKTMLRHRRR